MVTTRSGFHRAVSVVGASAVLAGAALGMSASPAHAAAKARNGHCQSGEFCLYFNSNQKGSVSDFKKSIPNYGATQPSCYEFKGAGKGKGKCVKNHTASAWNRTSKTVYVYYNSYYGGKHQAIKPGKKVNLNKTLKNDNASHHIGKIKSGSPQKPRNDYPYKSKSPNGVDPWNFYYRECTSFAAYRVNSRDHVKFSNSYKGQHWGNAGHWYTAAKHAKGVTVNRTPKVGAIAVNTVHKVGHVAYINKVYANGSFDIEEYNWGVSHGYTTRHISGLNGADGGFQYAIHF